MIITVDGPAAAGKGTLSQKLAENTALHILIREWFIGLSGC